MNNRQIFPKWLQELKRFQSLRSEFFLYGNVYDCYYFPDNHKEAQEEADLKYTKYNDIALLLQDYFLAEGYDVVSYFDVIDGLRIVSRADEVIDEKNIISILGLKHKDVESFLANTLGKKQLHDAISFYRELNGNSARLSVGIINYASRFTSSPHSLEEPAARIFLQMLKAAQESKVFANKDSLRNILVFLCDKLTDIPSWILVENPLIKGIEIQKPNREERSRFLEKRGRLFFQEGEDTNSAEISRVFPDLTEDFSNRELENLIAVSTQEKLHLNRIKEIIELFKYGIRDNPWETIDPQKVENAENELGKRVLGQDAAINKAVAIIRRSNLGLDAIDKTRPSNRPKGVLFFAGPTGTGKTELAKSLAELIFSDEEAMIRFDMSEYSDSNSDVKLIGSPPGYVGHEEGGQLTDAVRKRPFSIILFDEIEKAHSKIFDKFLQILDDGRLTDGKGETVYFSQSLIIFTSNLGVFREDEFGRKVQNIHSGEEYSEIEKKIKAEIENFFGAQLGRPEIFNRFGDNFVVFDYIRPGVAGKIVKKNLEVIKTNLLRTRNISFDYDDTFVDSFVESCALDNLEKGGRGIVNRIESHIKNGLTEFMFHTKKMQNCVIRPVVQNGIIEFQ